MFLDLATLHSIDHRGGGIQDAKCTTEMMAAYRDLSACIAQLKKNQARGPDRPDRPDRPSEEPKEPANTHPTDHCELKKILQVPLDKCNALLLMEQVGKFKNSKDAVHAVNDLIDKLPKPRKTTRVLKLLKPVSKLAKPSQHELAPLLLPTKLRTRAS